MRHAKDRAQAGPSVSRVGARLAPCTPKRTGAGIEERDMPYNKISDLPKEQVDQYSQHQKEAFLAAFNNAYEEYGHDESRAFAVAHSAAQRAPKVDRDGDHR